MLCQHVHERVAYKLYRFLALFKKKTLETLIRLMRVYLKGTFPEDDT